MNSLSLRHNNGAHTFFFVCPAADVYDTRYLLARFVRLAPPGARKKKQEASDARLLRSAIVNILEEACLPGVTDEEKRRLVSFVVSRDGSYHVAPKNKSNTTTVTVSWHLMNYLVYTSNFIDLLPYRVERSTSAHHIVALDELLPNFIDLFRAERSATAVSRHSMTYEE